ncbi:Ca2+-binding RTX toxin-like protein [Loktanella ponticola]|uniref:Ca2+-binding RTX toxin-like protein n=1 Tax=Yoonia ponticola TaxID=1524255 RepID=A0A7W9EZB7_9RHOB|nr:Ca2+-binding RTX toxin-like protein [Yoonia ponticola]
MPEFALIQMILRPADIGTSRITDLAIGTGALGDVLYSTTRFDGQIDSWDIAGNTLAPRDSDGFAIGPIAGNQPTLAFWDGQLLSGGGVSGGLTLRDLHANGTLGTASTLGGTNSFAGPLVQPVVTTLLGGNTSLHAGISNDSGIVQVIMDPAGTVISTTTISDKGRTAADQITAMATSIIDGVTFIFTASAADLGISAWQVRDAGNLTARETLRPETGLWVSSPTAIEAINVDGQDYVVMASAGSGSLTVISTGSVGELAVVDHVIDDRNTRFDGVTALATTVHQGQTWVFAGGSDDGITAFQVLNGGRLLARAHIADTTTMTLANISALAARSNGTSIDIFAASATDPGLTRLSLSIHANDDVIIDPHGANTLSGGAGADVFVMAADGQTDTISDFTQGEDTLDLSDWNGLRSINQLYFTALTGGIQITYGDEILILRSANGTDIAASGFVETDLIAPARIPQIITAGTSGPITDVPDLPDRPELGEPTPDPIEPTPTNEIYGTRDPDTLTGSDDNDLIYGMGGNDRLYGGAGADLLFGGQGNDLLRGGSGHDFLFGGAGRDDGWQSLTTAFTSTNADTLEGDAGNDELYGQAGDDRLDGGSGNDLLTGGGGRDTFVFRSGQDRATDFNPITDRIALDDALWTGSLTASQIVDRFATDTGADTLLDFGSGNSLRLDDFDDLDLLAGQIDIF